MPSAADPFAHHRKSRDRPSFEGKVALVTGAASGIGLGTAQALVQAGAAVALVDRDKPAVEAAAQMIVDDGGSVIAIAADVGNESSVDAMVSEALRAFGRLDCAFNNAGIAHAMAPAADIDIDSWDAVMRVNVRGTWLCMRAQIPPMLAGGGGAIVNMASISALRGMRGLAAYTASKHAVLGMTRAAAVDYAAQGIRINAICPGAVHTPMTDKSLEGLSPQDAEDQLRQRASFGLLGRLGTIQEMADTVCYLLSDQASFVVGQAINVDGGWTA
ncbi:SDR family NAD(P)-dependent oxidoreductase [Rhizorhabdus argentea]|uniref:SDR family NAD(P)-dependent oxidoreductase n=1 Tax=Rhizorhabdus argentea TaxID=1387174 RepID=UPI0030EBDA76